jgi:hypothetical protein
MILFLFPNIPALLLCIIRLKIFDLILSLSLYIYIFVYLRIKDIQIYY